jgi:hypothetical protein
VISRTREEGEARTSSLQRCFNFSYRFVVGHVAVPRGTSLSTWPSIEWHSSLSFQLEDFPSAPPAELAGSEDPTADFLARERAILGDDFGAFSSTTPDAAAASAAAPTSSAPAAIDVFPELTSPEPTSADPQRSSFVSSFERDVEDIKPPAPHVSVTADDEVAAFEDQFPEVPTEPSAPPAQVSP